MWVYVQMPLLATALALPPIPVMLGVTWSWPIPLPWLARVIGIAGVILAVLLFRAAARALGPDLVATPGPRAGSPLREGGVYELVRHPMYLSIIMGTVSWACVWCNFPALLLSGVCLVFFNLKTRYEERLLRAHFPAYTAYSARVPRLLPRPSRLLRRVA